MKKIFAVLLLSLFSHVGYATNLPDFPFVVSFGIAEKEVKPDIATIDLQVTAFAKDSETALQQVGTATDRVVEILASYEVGLESIEASDIKKSTTRKRDSEYNRLDILGYEVTRSVTLSFDDLSRFSEIMSDIVAVDNVSGTRAEFDLSNRKELERELVKVAAVDAREKAEQLATSLDTKIDSVYAVSQVTDFSSLVASFGVYPGNFSLDMAGVDLGPISMFAPKSIKISQKVNVVFRLQ